MWNYMSRRIIDYDKIRELADGNRSSTELAEIVGCSSKAIQKIMLKLNLPRRRVGPPPESKNPAWQGGHTIDQDGYLLVRAPVNHSTARKSGYILKHRLLMEQHLGRYLLPGEVVDHIDGNTLNNQIENLRLFASNGEHLKATLTGKTPNWSAQGALNCGKGKDPLPVDQRVDTYRQNKKQGEIRRRRIAHAHETLDILQNDLQGMERLLVRKKRVPNSL